MKWNGWYIIIYYFYHALFQKKDARKQDGWSTIALGVLRSSHPLTDTALGDYQKAAGWSGGGRSAKKSSGILSCLIFHLLTCTPYLGSKPKTGGSVAARKG